MSTTGLIVPLRQTGWTILKRGFLTEMTGHPGWVGSPSREELERLHGLKNRHATPR
jgi:hypothetical protein